MLQRRLILRGVSLGWGGESPRVLFRVGEDIIDSLHSFHCFKFKKRKLGKEEPPKVGHSVVFESNSRMAFLEVVSTDYSFRVDGVFAVRWVATTEKYPVG